MRSRVSGPADLLWPRPFDWKGGVFHARRDLVKHAVGDVVECRTNKSLMGWAKRARGGKGGRGSVEKVQESDLGDGLRLEVHKLTPPRDPGLRSRMERARVAMERGDTVVAAALAREVWRDGRGDKFIGVWAGQMLAKYGEPEEAAEVYCTCEGLDAGSWEAYWQLGRFLLMNALHERAVLFLHEAVGIEPRAIDAHLDLARCFAALGRTAEAQASLDNARRLDSRAKL